MRRWLIFERPIGSKCWTQTIDKGQTRCVGYVTAAKAAAVIEKQQSRNDEWEYVARCVTLPK